VVHTRYILGTCQVYTRYKQYLGIMMQYDPVGVTGAAVRQHTPHHYQLTCQSSSSQLRQLLVTQVAQMFADCLQYWSLLCARRLLTRTAVPWSSPCLRGTWPAIRRSWKRWGPCDRVMLLVQTFEPSLH
jgi:hypothetical protein